MAKKLTITVSDDVYTGLHRVIGPELDAAYREMAADEGRESEALDWSESVLLDV